MAKYRLAAAWCRLTGVSAAVVLFFVPMIGQGQTDPAGLETTVAASTADTDTLATLISFAKLRNELLQDIKALNKQIDSAESEAEKGKLRQELEKLESDLRATTRNLENIAAGVDISLLRAKKQEEFNFQKEIFALALLLVLAILLLSRLSYATMQRYLPGFRKKHRSFRVRLVELVHRLFTVIMVIFGPMIVFYLVEDWVLFSLGILLLLGIALTLRHTLLLYWHQVQLFLNVGSVREGERVMMEGLPWLVERINIYCTFSNPVADISQRLPIADLVDLKSRPAKPDEPWFPCKKGDWVILSDGVRGRVTGISHELVQLVERGGAQLTYQTGDFLAKSPRNLATNFRIKESLGISYALQKESTTSIPETLHHYIQQRAEQEGYGEQLLNLRVEFAQAGNSSLDLAVIADFKGELGDLYNRLRRAIQRWCVDACTEYGWEIPFQQMTLHGAVARAELVGV